MSLIEILRQYKVGPFSIFDFLVAYGGFYVLAPLLVRFFRGMRVRITRANIMWLVLPLSVLAHLLVGTQTPLTRMVLDVPGSYVTKLVILITLYFGFRGIIWRLPKESKC